MGTAGTFVGDLRTVLRGRDFRRLFATRLVSQSADGAFQVGLAGVIFFSPERAATAGRIALAFTVAVLPYTLVGPWAGVLLDHWRRRQVLVGANALRALLVAGTAALAARGVVGAPLYLAVLASMSVNRFFLAGIGASLPHVVPPHELVMANSVAPTSGTVVAIGGGVAGYGIRAMIGSGDTADATIVLLAALVYAAAALLATRMEPELLGPDAAVRLPWSGVRAAAVGVARGLVAAGGHLRRRRAAAAALGVTAAMRFAYGVAFLMLVLMCRNRFTDPRDVGAGLALLTTVVAASGIGFGLAAVVTPAATQRLSARNWIVVCLLAAAGIDVVLLTVAPFALVVVAAALLGIATQGSKICVDAIVQAAVDDEFRGRVFSVYDVVFNAAFVAAAAVSALLLPRGGYSRPVLLGLAVVHLSTAFAYGRNGSGRLRRTPSSTGRGGSVSARLLRR